MYSMCEDVWANQTKYILINIIYRIHVRADALHSDTAETQLHVQPRPRVGNDRHLDDNPARGPQQPLASKPHDTYWDTHTTPTHLIAMFMLWCYVVHTRRNTTLPEHFVLLQLHGGTAYWCRWRRARGKANLPSASSSKVYALKLLRQDTQKQIKTINSTLTVFCNVLPKIQHGLFFVIYQWIDQQ